MEKEYIQYSKKVTKWGMTLVGILAAACLALVAFRDMPAYRVSAVVDLYTGFATVLGVTIGAYQGNSSIEKWTRARYQTEDDDDTAKG